MERGDIGRTACFVPSKLDGAGHGAFMRARLTGIASDRLTAERVA
jgi:hypothetical protein